MVNYLALLGGACWGEYPTHGCVEDADCVLAFSMGYGVVDGEYVPGAGNGELALYIHVNFAARALPVLAQKEIAVALEALGYPGEIIPFCQLGEKTTTHDVAEQMVSKMADPHPKYDGPLYEDPVLVASAYYAARADLVVRWFRVEPIVPEGLPKALDSASAQRRTRNPTNWTFWELGAWPHHYFRGWI